MANDNIYVLDTSAWMTYFDEEEGAPQLREWMYEAAVGQRTVLSSFACYMEVYYIAKMEVGVSLAKYRYSRMSDLPVLRIESNPGYGLKAGELKAECKISFADAWVAALALEKNATLIHKDPEFEKVQGLKYISLPYKPTRRKT